MSMLLLSIMPAFLFLFDGSDAAVTASVQPGTTWNGGGQGSVVITNSGPDAVCSVTVQMTAPSGTTVTSVWGMDSKGNNQYTTPSWVNIAAGASYTQAGFNYNGNQPPSASVVSSTPCGGSSGGGGGGSATTTTTQATTTTTQSSGGGGGGGGGSGGATLTVTTDPSNAAINSCKESSATGPVTSVLNKPYTNGIFTFYGAGGTGACGLDSSKPGMSAAASGQLFNSNQNWVAPCTGSQYILNDAICMNKCVKITYTCVGCSSAKTLIVPINNKCPECAPDHVDLSQSAFNYLEPQGGTVGIAKNAVITYIECP